MRTAALITAALAAPLLGLGVATPAATPQEDPQTTTTNGERVITFMTPRRHNSLVVFARPRLSVKLAPGSSDLRIWLNGRLITSKFTKDGNRYTGRIGKGDGLRIGSNTLSVGADNAAGERKSATRIFRAVRQDRKGVVVAQPARGQEITTAPFPVVIRTRQNLSEFRVWLNKREVTGLFGPPVTAKANGYVVQRARVPASRGLRPGGNVLKVRAVTDNFRHQTVFRAFQAAPAVTAG
jgi:hypothetical protein